MTTNLSKLAVVYRFFSGTGFSYDRVATLCTWGFDRYWKRRIIAAIPSGSARILDQACGTGILTLQIARTVITTSSHLSTLEFASALLIMTGL